MTIQEKNVLEAIKATNKNIPTDWGTGFDFDITLDESGFITGLDFLFKDLENIPSEIGNLRRLTKLDLYGTFTNLPSEIGQLTNLTYLRIQGNIGLIPADIGRLYRLKSLSIDGKFDFLPSEIGNLKNLEYLKISSSNLLELPQSIGNLSNLKTLTIDFCPKLTNIPYEIGKLRQLTKLQLNGSFTTLPSTLKNLSNLEELTFWECRRLRFSTSTLEGESIAGPSTFDSFTKLGYLGIYGCKDLDYVPPVWNLTRLEALSLHNCPNLTTLPKGMNCLKNLTDLSLSDCMGLIPSSATFFPHLRRLRHLNLSGTQFRRSDIPNAVLNSCDEDFVFID